MSRYLEILALQGPTVIGVDENQRVMFSVNFEARAAANVDQWEEEIVDVLVDAGVATLNTDTFIGPLAVWPTGAGPYANLLNTGGSAPDETHNGDKYENLSAQILVKATNYKTARTRAQAIARALDGVRNQTVTA